MKLMTGGTADGFLDDQLVEMPCINNRFMGLKTRYAYNTLVSETPLFLMSGIQKWDFEAMAEVDRYELPEGKYMGQPVFAPKGEATGEEDGYLIARSEEHTSELQSLMRNSYAVFCLKKKTKITKT